MSYSLTSNLCNFLKAAMTAIFDFYLEIWKVGTLRYTRFWVLKIRDGFDMYDTYIYKCRTSVRYVSDTDAALILKCPYFIDFSIQFVCW